MREGKYHLKNKSTEILTKVNLDGQGKVIVDSGYVFIDHLVKSFATHSLIDINLKVIKKSKNQSINKIACCLGRALRDAISKGKNVKNYGFAIIPMDCSIAFSAIDLTKNVYIKINLKLTGQNIEDTPSEYVQKFLEKIGNNILSNLHIWVKYGNNDHHKAEVATKAFAISLKQAIRIKARK